MVFLAILKPVAEEMRRRSSTENRSAESTPFKLAAAIGGEQKGWRESLSTAADGILREPLALATGLSSNAVHVGPDR